MAVSAFVVSAVIAVLLTVGHRRRQLRKRAECAVVAIDGHRAVELENVSEPSVAEPAAAAAAATSA